MSKIDSLFYLFVYKFVVAPFFDTKFLIVPKPFAKKRVFFSIFSIQ